MYYYVYVLFDKNGNFYIGYTRDLKKRIKEHKSGEVISTKAKLPVILIYYEASLNKIDALKRERYLKSGPGRKFLKNRMKNHLGLGPVRSMVRGSKSN